MSDTDNSPEAKASSDAEDQRAADAEGQEKGTDAPRLVKVDDKKPEGYEGSCLRPTGMCDLGGCCDVCWYSPTHPRFAKK